MRHLFALPLASLLLAACAAAGPAQPGTFTLAPRASAQVAPGLTLTYEGADDSRCPPDVQCVWAGRLSYRFSLRGDRGEAEQFALEPGKPGHASAQLAGARIELDAALAASPPARSASAGTPVTLRIAPRPSDHSPSARP